MPTKFRADHVGSLRRPAALLQAHSSKIGSTELHAIEDKHILRVLEKQKELGFKIFTDGELRRGNFMRDLDEAGEGIDEGVAVLEPGNRETAHRFVLRWCRERLWERSSRRAASPGMSLNS